MVSKFTTNTTFCYSIVLFIGILKDCNAFAISHFSTNISEPRSSSSEHTSAIRRTFLNPEWAQSYGPSSAASYFQSKNFSRVRPIPPRAPKRPPPPPSINLNDDVSSISRGHSQPTRVVSSNPPSFIDIGGILPEDNGPQPVHILEEEIWYNQRGQVQYIRRKGPVSHVTALSKHQPSLPRVQPSFPVDSSPIRIEIEQELENSPPDSPFLLFSDEQDLNSQDIDDLLQNIDTTPAPRTTTSTTQTITTTTNLPPETELSNLPPLSLSPVFRISNEGRRELPFSSPRVKEDIRFLIDGFPKRSPKSLIDRLQPILQGPRKTEEHKRAKIDAQPSTHRTFPNPKVHPLNPNFAFETLKKIMIENLSKWEKVTTGQRIVPQLKSVLQQQLQQIKSQVKNIPTRTKSSNKQNRQKQKNGQLEIVKDQRKERSSEDLPKLWVKRVPNKNDRESLIRPIRACVDEHVHCMFWARINECNKNPLFMTVYCCASCATRKPNQLNADNFEWKKKA